MTRWWPVVVLVFAGLGLAWMAGARPVERPTIRSVAGEGLLVAFRYIEESGRSVQSWEADASSLPEDGGTFLLALPVRRAVTAAETGSLAGWVKRGGHLVVMTSTSVTVPTPQPILDLLRVTEIVDETKPPLPWSEWKVWDAARRQLSGAEGDIRVTPGQRRVLCPATAEALYSDSAATPRVCRWRAGHGTMTVVQGASALSNARIGSLDNIDLLEALTQHEPILFDEWHQGFGGGESGLDLGVAPDALLAHAGLLYCVVAWTLSRPFGPVVSPLRDAASSTRRELLVLGALHHRGGHAVVAGQRLIDLAHSRFVANRLPWKGIPRTFEGGEEEFLALARRIGQLEITGREG